VHEKQPVAETQATSPIITRNKLWWVNFISFEPISHKESKVAINGAQTLIRSLDLSEPSLFRLGSATHHRYAVSVSRKGNATNGYLALFRFSMTDESFWTVSSHRNHVPPEKITGFQPYEPTTRSQKRNFRQC
jgi:hypothetical protein